MRELVSKSLIFGVILTSFFSTFGQIPSGYYSSATGTGYTLKTQLHDIIDGHNEQSYGAMWDFIYDYDLDNYYENDGTVLDIYSENPAGNDPYNWIKGSDQCGNYSGEGSCYNREHSFPKSWFGDASPMTNDAHHLYPTDGYVNGQRGSLPFGEVGSASFTSANGSKKGSGRSGLGYTGTVFEPIDEFKGDLARSYFYMATRYEDIISGWNSEMLDGSSDHVYEDWALEMLITWHENDPLSQKEIDRNNNIHYNHQGNRNPFVDHPEWVNTIWGDGTVDPTPTISLTESSINLGEVIAGNSSASQSYTVSGTDLEGNIAISVSAPFELSLNNSSWSQQVTVTQSSGTAGDMVYVRFSPIEANGAFESEEIIHTSTDAITKSLTVSGTEGTMSNNPSLVLNTSGFNSDFGTLAVGADSDIRSYEVSGTNLPESVNVSAPDGFMISVFSNFGFSASLVLGVSEGTLSAKPIYVQFSPGQSGSLDGNITHISGSTQEALSVLGSGGMAELTIDASSFNGDFGQVIVGQSSVVGSYLLSASNLSEEVQISAPPGFEVSLSEGTGFNSTVSITGFAALSEQPIYIRFKPTFSGSFSGNIVSSSGSESAVLSVSGSGVQVTGVVGKPSIIIYPNPVEGVLKIDHLPNGGTIRIFDSMGRRMNVKKKGSGIDISEFDPGQYYLTVAGSKNGVMKFLVK